MQYVHANEQISRTQKQVIERKLSTLRTQIYALNIPVSLQDIATITQLPNLQGYFHLIFLFFFSD